VALLGGPRGVGLTFETTRPDQNRAFFGHRVRFLNGPDQAGDPGWPGSCWARAELPGHPPAMDGAPDADQATLRRFRGGRGRPLGTHRGSSRAASADLVAGPRVDLTHDRATLLRGSRPAFTRGLPSPPLALAWPRMAARRSARPRANGRPIARGPRFNHHVSGILVAREWGPAGPAATPSRGWARWGRGTGRSSSWPWPPS